MNCESKCPFSKYKNALIWLSVSLTNKHDEEDRKLENQLQRRNGFAHDILKNRFSYLLNFRSLESADKP